MDNLFNRDQEIAEDRKDIGIKEEDKAPLRDQIVQKLYNELEDRNIGQHVIRLWQGVSDDKSEWMSRQEEFLSDWDEFIQVDPQGVFEASSNLHIPVSLWVAKSYHARFLQTIFTPDINITLKSRKSAHIDRANNLEALLKYTLSEWCNYRNGIEETVDQWVWSWITTGIGVIKWRWDAKFRKYIDVVERAVPGPIKYLVDPSTGEEIAIPTKRIIEEEADVVEKVFEGPVCEFVNFEDIGIVSQDITDISNADAVIHRQWLTASELWTLVERKIFNAEAVEHVIKAGEDLKSSATGANIKSTRQYLSGESTLDKNHDLKRYEILEAYLSIDLNNGSGINSDVVVWVHAETGELLRATYLHRMNKSGECPINVITFHKRSGNNSHLPIGLVEIIHPIVKEIDAMHNMRVDFGLISTVPFGFYRSSSSLNPKDLKLEPGVMYPLDNPQSDVYFPQLGNRTSFGHQEEQLLFTLIERLTGINDMSLGVMSGSQGATRTATGARILQQEVGINLDVPLKRLNRGWKKALECCMHMLQQRLPSDFEFKVTGELSDNEYRTISGKDIVGDFDFEVSPSAASSNKQIQFDNAMQLMQLTSNPIDLQLGIVTPQNRFEAIKNFLKTLGIKEISRYISSQFENTVTLTPKEELERVLMGLNVPVLPTSDHDGIIALGQELINKAMLQPEAAALLQAHINKHSNMKNAVEALAAQQANMQQIVTNQSLGTSTSPAVMPQAPVMPSPSPVTE